ncbi:MAG: hypothetical protein QXU20_00835 [Candidatus Woesearchaeota archaeon]
MVLIKKVFIFFVLFALLFFIGCSKNKEEFETGIVRKCSFTMGEDTCGKCYCLETKEFGCEIIDFSEVGDLTNFVDMKVKYYGTRNQSIIKATRMCPKQIKLFKISLLEES